MGRQWEPGRGSLEEGWEYDQPPPKSMAPLLLMLAVCVALAVGLVCALATGGGR